MAWRLKPRMLAGGAVVLAGIAMIAFAWMREEDARCELLQFAGGSPFSNVFSVLTL